MHSHHHIPADRVQDTPRLMQRDGSRRGGTPGMEHPRYRFTSEPFTAQTSKGFKILLERETLLAKPLQDLPHVANRGCS